MHIDYGNDVVKYLQLLFSIHKQYVNISSLVSPHSSRWSFPKLLENILFAQSFHRVESHSPCSSLHYSFFDPLAITQILELIHGDRSETGRNQVLYQIGKIHLEITEFGSNISLALIAWIHWKDKNFVITFDPKWSRPNSVHSINFTLKIIKLFDDLGAEFAINFQFWEKLW